MPKFWISIYHRDDYDAFAVEDPEMHQAIDDLNDAMVAAGIRVFVGGLHHASKATSILLQPDGQTVTQPGSYLQTNEHEGGFWVLDVPTEEDAVEWGRRAAIACRTPVQVRQFH